MPRREGALHLSRALVQNAGRVRTLLLASLLLAAAPARAVDPVDLTEYLAPRAEVGDYKVWEGRGIGALREEVIAVADEGDGYRIERRYTDLGVEIGRSEQFVVPGGYESITHRNHRFVGFADWADPRGVHPLAAVLTSRASTRSRHTLRGSWAWVFSPRVDGEKVERGFVAGVGLVGATAAYRTVVNGVVTKRFAEDLELGLAVVQGVAYPPQD